MLLTELFVVFVEFWINVYVCKESFVALFLFFLFKKQNVK